MSYSSVRFYRVRRIDHARSRIEQRPTRLAHNLSKLTAQAKQKKTKNELERVLNAPRKKMRELIVVRCAIDSFLYVIGASGKPSRAQFFCISPFIFDSSRRMSKPDKKGFSQAAVVPLSNPVETLLKILKETEAKVNENAIRLALCKKQSELRSARIVELLKETEAKVNENMRHLALCEKESELRSARIVELEKELAALRSVAIPKPVSEAGSDNRS